MQKVTRSRMFRKNHRSRPQYPRPGIVKNSREPFRAVYRQPVRFASLGKVITMFVDFSSSARFMSPLWQLLDQIHKRTTQERQQGQPPRLRRICSGKFRYWHLLTLWKENHLPPFSQIERKYAAPALDGMMAAAFWSPSIILSLLTFSFTDVFLSFYN